MIYSTATRTTELSKNRLVGCRIFRLVDQDVNDYIDTRPLNLGGGFIGEQYSQCDFGPQGQQFAGWVSQHKLPGHSEEVARRKILQAGSIADMYGRSDDVWNVFFLNLSDVIKPIDSAIEVFGETVQTVEPEHLIIKGPWGTGKTTTLLHALNDSLGVPLGVTFGGPSFFSSPSFAGQAPLPNGEESPGLVPVTAAPIHPALAFGKTVMGILWSSVRHPGQAIEIDKATGRCQTIRG